MNATLASTTRRVARALLVMLVAAVALSTLQSAPASAYAVRSSGSPGRVVGHQVQGSHYNTCLHTPFYGCYTPWVVGTGPAVYRSPASRGTQKITAVYNLQRWNGSRWVHHSQRMHVRYLQSGYSSLRMPRVDFQTSYAGYFRVVIGVAWSNYHDTVGFGARSLTYKHSGDFVCNTRFPCQTGPGWVWLRSPGA